MGLVILQQSILLFAMDGTGDDGDSVEHYMHNHYVFDYPYLLIHTWARPFFVLVSCLFAQFGFIGIKLFNSIMAIGAAFLAYKLAKKIKIPHAEFAIPILMCMPDYLKLSLSGLTEPLFSFMAVYSLLLLAKNKSFWAAIVLSLLPFVRPEGLYFIALGAVFFTFKGNSWKYLPWLLFGHIFYTVLGVVAFGESWLWVFTKNPNAMIHPAYNQTGTWLHYIRAMRAVLGIPTMIFFWMGFIAMALPILMQLKKKFKDNLIAIFILASTASVIVTHTIFWKFGLFKSFGLTRNLLTVAPLMSIIAVAGMQGLWRILKLNSNRTFWGTLISTLGIIIFLYSGSKFTAKFPTDFQLSPLQELSIEVADYIKEEHPKTSMLYHYYPYLNLELGQDPFDGQHYKVLFKEVINDKLPSNTIIVWDDWFAIMEGKITLDMLDQNKEIEHVKTFKTKNKRGKERSLVVFKTKLWQ